MYTPAQVAKRANAHPNSIRNWARDYAEFLSPGASGADGPRLFSDEDVEVLCAVAALRKSGASPAAVVAHLRERDKVIDLAPQTPQQAIEAIQEPPAAQTGIQVAYINLQGRVETLERRVDVGASQLITGIVIGAAVVLVVVAIVLRML